MKIAIIKGMVAKVLTVGFLAGAVVMFAPVKAQAQVVVVRNGGYYARHDFYEQERIEAFRRHREFEREREFRRFSPGWVLSRVQIIATSSVERDEGRALLIRTSALYTADNDRTSHAKRFTRPVAGSVPLRLCS